MRILENLNYEKVFPIPQSGNTKIFNNLSLNVCPPIGSHP